MEKYPIGWRQMSEAKFQAARELIQEKRYDLAGALLSTMPNNERAQSWLARLDKRPSKRRRLTLGTWMMIWGGVAVVLLCVALAIFYIQEKATMRQTSSEYACSLIYERDSTQWQACVDGT